MFGNRMNYTKSPGGIRRGLIYQSSEGRKDFSYDNWIKLNQYSSVSRFYLWFERNGDITFRLNQSDFSVVDFPINVYTLYGVWYPIDIIPIYTIEVGNLSIDIGQIPSLITNPDNDVLIKKDTMNVTAWDGSSLTIDVLIVYYDITNVATYTSGGTVFYDIKNDHANRIYRTNGLKQKISVLSDTYVGMKGKMRYFTYPQDNLDYLPIPTGGGNALVPVRYNELNEAYCEYSGKIWYEQLSPSYPNRYLPYIKFYHAHFKGDYPIHIEALSQPYGLPFLLPPLGDRTEFGIHWYDTQTHQIMPNWNALYPTLDSAGQSYVHSSPSNFIVEPGNYMPGDNTYYMCLTYNTSLYEWHYGVDDPNELSAIWGLNFKLSNINSYQANSFDEIAPTP